MKLAAWNLNSLKVRLPHLLDWLAFQQVDVVSLQETKVEDPVFPREAIEAAGYHAVFCGQKTYNGVALLSKSKIQDVVYGNPLFPDPQKRLISGVIDGIRVVCAYFPNGQAVGSDKYAYKLAWMKALHSWLSGFLGGENPENLALCGDFNIAPGDEDVYDPKQWAGGILCSAPEREAFQGFLNLGMKDSFRLFEQPKQSFSWWDYRMFSFQKNQGLRIDHILLSEALSGRCAASGIDCAPRKLERPSDHAPVWVEIRA